MKVLVTGNAGFVGFHVSKRLLERGDDVVGFDNMSDYYDPALKVARVRETERTAKRCGSRFEFLRADLLDDRLLEQTFERHGFDRVVHVAAQPGVRYSIDDPRAYVASNVNGFLNVLEACRNARVPHLTYASSSSVYGANTSMPYRESHRTDHPLSLYAATKRSNELMAHSYSHLFGLPTTGLRLFTVYGPWGRPDMSPFLFTKNILEGRPIKVFNHGNHSRDFTYVDDVAEGIVRASDQVAVGKGDWDSDKPNPATSDAPFRIFNVGNGSPVLLGEFIEALEEAVGIKAIKEMVPHQQGDVRDTFADVTALYEAVEYQPQTLLKAGVAEFVDWYRDFYGV